MILNYVFLTIHRIMLIFFFAFKLLHEIVMLIKGIEHFQTFIYKLYCVVVAARQNTKGGQKTRNNL